MQKEIKQSWQFTQSPKEVWDYLTKPELIEQWLMKNNFQPVVGHKFRFTFVSKPDGKYKDGVECEVLEVKPFNTLSYSWNGTTKDDRAFSSIVLWTLIPNDNGTELQLQHNGFNLLEDVLSHTEGWRNCINKMKSIHAMKS